MKIDKDIYSVIEPYMAGKKAAIFDMDGTLLDSMSMWAVLDIQYMKEMGITPRPDFHRIMTSMTLPMASEYIAKEYPVPYSAREVYNQILDMADKYYRYKLPVKAKVPSLIKHLYDDGIHMMVATANEYDMSRAALERNNVFQYMDGIVTCTMAGANKQNPAVFLMACDKMNVSVGECVVFEDSLYAIKTAREAGFMVIGVYDEGEKENWDEICSITDCQVVLDDEQK